MQAPTLDFTSESHRGLSDAVAGSGAVVVSGELYVLREDTRAVVKRGACRTMVASARDGAHISILLRQSPGAQAYQSILCHVCEDCRA